MRASQFAALGCRLPKTWWNPIWSSWASKLSTSASLCPVGDVPSPVSKVDQNQLKIRTSSGIRLGPPAPESSHQPPCK